MSHRFEMSRLILLTKIVTNSLLDCFPIHGVFFSTHIWDMILDGNLYTASLSTAPAQGFSLLLNLMTEPYHIPKLENHPVLPDKGFESLQYVLCFINGCKWFLMSVCHPTYYFSTIAFQGLYFLENQMTDSNMAAR